MKQRDTMRIRAAEAQGWTGPWRFGNVHLHGTPPGKTPETRGHEGEHVPEVVDKIIVELCRQVEYLVSRVTILEKHGKVTRHKDSVR